MKNPKPSMRSNGQPTSERGVALVIALLALTVLTGIGFAIMVSSSTESLINAGFRRSSLAHFAAMAGLEEIRGRMGPDALRTGDTVSSTNCGSNTTPATACTVSSKIPCLNATSCPPLYDVAARTANLNAGYYILLNTSITPAGSCTYLGVSCGDPNPPSAPRYYLTLQPGTPMPYVWVKVTLATQRKLNRNLVTPGTLSGLDDTRMICWKGFNLTVAEPFPLPNPSSVCGDPVNPVFLYTAMSIQPGRAVRLVRELGALGKFPNLPGGLTLNGCPGSFTPPTSHPFQLSGIDVGNAGDADDSHAITVRCPGDVTTIHNLITDGNKCSPVGAAMGGCQAGPNHNSDYPGVGNQNCNNPNCNTAINSADIYYDNSLATSNDYLKDCAGVQALVSYIEQAADYTYPAGTTNLITNGINTAGNGSNSNPDLWDRVINVIKGDAALSQSDFSCGTNCPGAGIILVEGNLTVNGYPSYNGIIAVIGGGQMTVTGGGNGTINGGILLTNTTTCPANLGPVSFNNPGGGTFALNYNSNAIKPKDGLLPVRRLSLNY